MAMTKKELRGKQEIEKRLAEQGYPTYARIFHEFDLNITNDPNVIAYMEPGKGRIVVNGELDLDGISVVIRHEILHEYLKHESRLVRHVAKIKGIDPSTLDDKSIKEIKNIIYSSKNFNIAGDYEISNVGYTEADKRTIRNLVLNGKIVSGLVTETDHPDWVDLPLEDMYDRLNKELQNDYDDLNKALEDGDFEVGDCDGSGGCGQSVDPSKLSDKAKKNLEDKLKKNGPQIGDKGDPDTQAAEEEEREKNAVDGGSGSGQEDKQGEKKPGSGSGQGNSEDKDDQEGSGSGAGDQESDKEGQEGEGEGEGQGDSENKPSNSSQSSGDGPSEKGGPGAGGGSISAGDYAGEDNGIPERIRKFLSDPGIGSKLKGEVSRIKEKEKEDRIRKEVERYKKSGIYRFKLSLSNFLKKELDDERDYTWKKFNKTYANSDLVKAGRATEDGPVPLINIYFDQSGSWDAGKIAVGEKAMGLIYKYQNEGKLRARVYYFSSDVTSDVKSRMLHGGTNGQPIMDHIKSTRPDNVIIMTDSDIDDIRENVTVPGAVWLLFKGGRSRNLIDHIRGKKETVVLDI